MNDSWVVQTPLRLDRSVAERVGSRQRARDVLQSGKVWVDGAPVGLEAAGIIVPVGAVVDLRWNTPGTGRTRTKGRVDLQEHGVEVIYEDPDLVVFNKPTGLLTDTASEAQRKAERSLVALARPYLTSADTAAAHRLDRDTTGAVVIARTPAAFEGLRAQFHARSPVRIYRALIHGDVGPGGRFDDPMLWDRKLLIQRAPRQGERGEVASARWTRIGSSRGVSLVEVQLETGKRNQIRLHWALVGRPLVGERLYLPPGWRARPPQAPRQMLHAAHLGFLHPRTQAPLAFDVPPPPDFRAVLGTVGLPWPPCRPSAPG